MDDGGGVPVDPDTGRFRCGAGWPGGRRSPAIRDLLGYAMAAAAVTVSRSGADLPTVADVEASLAAADLPTEVSEIDLRKRLA